MGHSSWGSSTFIILKPPDAPTPPLLPRNWTRVSLTREFSVLSLLVLHSAHRLRREMSVWNGLVNNTGCNLPR